MIGNFAACFLVIIKDHFFSGKVSGFWQKRQKNQNTLFWKIFSFGPPLADRHLDKLVRRSVSG